MNVHTNGGRFVDVSSTDQRFHVLLQRFLFVGKYISGHGLVAHQLAVFYIPPSHRRRGATAVLVRHKPQWHRHDRRGSSMVLVIDRRSTAENCQNRGPSRWHGGNFEHVPRASAVLVSSHRRRCATAVLVRHKPQ